jgi:hypothetical protein
MRSAETQRDPVTLDAAALAVSFGKRLIRENVAYFSGPATAHAARKTMDD